MPASICPSPSATSTTCSSPWSCVTSKHPVRVPKLQDRPARRSVKATIKHVTKDTEHQDPDWEAEPQFTQLSRTDHAKDAYLNQANCEHNPGCDEDAEHDKPDGSVLACVIRVFS